MLLLLVLVGCSAGQPAQQPSDPPSELTSEQSTAAPSVPPDGPSPRAGSPVDSPACEQVRAGIAAFNEGDYEETVARFVAAVPLAEEQVDGSVAADGLLEAVRWYAALPADDYLAAFQESPEFERYQQITLGQCLPVDGPAPSPSEPGVEA